MIIVLTVVMALLFILGVWMESETYVEGAGVAIGVISAIGFCICFVAMIVLGVQVSNLKVIDQKIEMYEQENAEIEEQVAEVVKQYQEYETGIFTDVSPESAVTLVALYPNLKSDTLVQKQIEIYLDNNETIKELKTSKINGSVKRWWLYFGG